IPRPNPIAARNARHANPSYSSVRNSARASDRAAHPTYDRRLAASGAWVALSCAPPAGTERMDCGQVGARGGEPETGIQILPAHRGWKEATRRRGVEVEEINRRGRTDHVACRGELRCGGGAAAKKARTIWNVNCDPIWNWRLRNSVRRECPRRKRVTQR